MAASAGNQGAEFHPVGRHGHTLGPYQMTWRDESGTPVNLAGATFEAPIFDTGIQVDSFDVTLVSAIAGIISFVLPYTRSALLAKNKALQFHLSATVGANKVPLLAGAFTLKSE